MLPNIPVSSKCKVSTETVIASHVAPRNRELAPDVIASKDGGKLEDKSISQALRRIYAREGWRGFFKGNGTSRWLTLQQLNSLHEPLRPLDIVRIVPYSAVQFMVFERLKRVRKGSYAALQHRIPECFHYSCLTLTERVLHRMNDCFQVLLPAVHQVRARVALFTQTL